MRGRQRWAVLGALCLLQAGCGDQEVFPERPIVLICPWSAGGGTDLIARQVAAALEQDLGVPVNVVNATGGSGVTGHTRGALARPDGYTLTIATVELNMLHWRGLTNITPADFEPLILLNQDDAALFVREDAPWRSLAELESACRANPRAWTASGTAQGGIWHMALAGWLDTIGLEPDAVVWVSINGSAPALQELMSGGIDMVCCSLPEAQALMEAGRIRPLGVMAPARLAGFPDVPTFREQGSDWSMAGWRGLMLPPGVPRDRARHLLAAAEKAVAQEAYLQFMQSSGFDHSAAPPDEFAALLQRADAQHGALLGDPAFRSVRHGPYGPLTFPAILAVGLGLTLATVLATGGLRRPADLEPSTDGGWGRVGLALAGIAGFVALLEPLGFVLSAALLLLILLRGLRVRWAVALAVVVTLVPATYQLFAVFLRVPLPWGVLGW